MCKNYKEEVKTVKERRLSFTSVNIMAGCMPEYVNLGDPTITVIMTFKNNPPSMNNVSAVASSFLQYHRLHSVPKQKTKKNLKHWIYERVEPNIDPKKMIRVVDICCDTKEEWADIVQGQRAVSLRRQDLPWWELVIMKNKGKEDHILLFRIDHGIADGLSVGKLFTNVITKSDGSPIDTLIPKSMTSNKKQAAKNWFSLLTKLPKSAFDVATCPIGRKDDPTRFSKNVVGTDLIDKRDQALIIFPSVPVDFIKKIKDKAGVSFNDVLLTAWCQAVEEYCKMYECPILKKKGERVLIRAFMTYGFPYHGTDHKNAIGNRWVPLPMRLPVGMKTLMEKLQRVCSRSKYLKSSPMPAVQLFLQNSVLSLLPTFLTRLIVRRTYAKISLSFTNVPGPQDKVCLMNEPVDSCMFLTNHIHPVLAFLSYNGLVNTTLSIRREAIHDSHLLPKCFMKALVLIGNELKIEVPNSIANYA